MGEDETEKIDLFFYLEAKLDQSRASHNLGCTLFFQKQKGIKSNKLSLDKEVKIE